MSWESFDVRIVIVGPARSGKTSLLTKWGTGAFPRGPYSPTSGSSFAAKRVFLDDEGGTHVKKVGVWDLSGARQFYQLSRAFVRGADVAIACYDATDRESWERLQGWVRDAREVEPGCTLFLFATKSDLVANPSTPDVHQAAETLQLTPKSPKTQPASPAQPAPLTPQVEERAASSRHASSDGDSSDGQGRSRDASSAGSGGSGREAGDDDAWSPSSREGTADSFWGSPGPASPVSASAPRAGRHAQQGGRGAAADRGPREAAPPKAPPAVSAEEEGEYASRVGARAFHVSARSGGGLREAFDAIVRQVAPALLQRRQAEAAAQASSPFARVVSISSRLAQAEGGLFAPVAGPGGRAYSTGDGSLAGGQPPGSPGASRALSTGAALSGGREFTFTCDALLGGGSAASGSVAFADAERGRGRRGSALVAEDQEQRGGRPLLRPQPARREGCRMT